MSSHLTILGIETSCDETAAAVVTRDADGKGEILGEPWAEIALGSAHEAQHQVMECLGEMVWASQRSGRPPDGHAYLDCVRRRATRG